MNWCYRIPEATQLPVLVIANGCRTNLVLVCTVHTCMFDFFFTCRQNPQHKVDYSTLVMNAEQSLERKWRKYFGGKYYYNVLFRNAPTCVPVPELV